MLKFLWNRIRRLGLLYNGRRDSKEPRLKCFHNGIILIEDRSFHKNMDFFVGHALGRVQRSGELEHGTVEGKHGPLSLLQQVIFICMPTP